MLEPDYLADISLELEQMYYDLETEILKAIAKEVKAKDYSKETDDFNDKLFKSVIIGKISAKISKLLKISQKEANTILSQSAYKSVEADNEIFKEAFDKGLISSYNYSKNTLKPLINKGIEALNNELGNICGTTAKISQKAFINASNNAYLAIQSGAFSFEQAVTTEIKKLAKEGLGIIEYRSGARRRLEGAIRNAVRTAVNQTACKCQDLNFEAMDGNLVETSSHMGARPEHALWQGEIFWRKEEVKGYRNFEEATKYGSGEGLGGWNCKHSWYPYFPGISHKVFEKYDLKENEELYNLTQEQRYNERMIREWDRRNQVCEAAGIDNTKEARKVREWRDRQTSFLNKHPELTRQYSREKGYASIKNSFRDTNSKNVIKRSNSKYDGLSRKYAISKEKEKNLLSSFIEIDKKYLSDGYEHLALIDRQTGKQLCKIVSSNSSKAVVTTSKMDKIINKAKPYSLSTIHNHPSCSTFSIGDIITLNNTSSFGEMIVINQYSESYYLSIPKGAKIDLSTTKKQDMLKEMILTKRKAIEKSIPDINVLDRNHLALKEICEELGWLYGRKRVQ